MDSRECVALVRRRGARIYSGEQAAISSSSKTCSGTRYGGPTRVAEGSARRRPTAWPDRIISSSGGSTLMATMTRLPTSVHRQRLPAQRNSRPIRKSAISIRGEVGYSSPNEGTVPLSIGDMKPHFRRKLPCLRGSRPADDDVPTPQGFVKNGARNILPERRANSLAAMSWLNLEISDEPESADAAPGGDSKDLEVQAGQTRMARLLHEKAAMTGSLAVYARGKQSYPALHAIDFSRNFRRRQIS